MLPKRKILFLLADIILVSFSVLLAFLIRFEGRIPNRYFFNIQGIILLALLITLPIFYFLKLYSFSWVYVSLAELVSLTKATILSFLLLTAFYFIFRDHPIFSGFPRSTLFITYFFIFILCGGIRFSKRVYLQIFPKGKIEFKEKTLIVGAGDAGEEILRSILATKESPYFPIGFVDDEPQKQGVVIHGIKVLGKIDEIPEIVKSENIEAMIIALPSAGAKVIKKAVEMGRKADLRRIKIVPSLSEIMDGRVSIGNLREVEVEDLLERGQIQFNEKSIENFIRQKSVLITGAAGSIGSELSRQVAKFFPSSLLLLDQDETGIFNISEELKNKFPKLDIHFFVGDILDKNKIERIFEKFKPKIVFHAAAYKHVPLMELEPEEAVKTNIFGTKIIVEASLRHKAEKFIFISTDKAVNPTSVMGATKRVGEMICQAFNDGTKFISVRFGNVLDSRGSVIPIFREKIKKREPIEITHSEMKRYFMTTSEACLLLMEAGAMGRGGEVFVLDMGKPVGILDLAKEMIRLSGFEPDKDIPIVITEPRPGEKFFEEILTAEEGTETTQHKKIFIAKLSKFDKEKLNLNLKKLEEIVEKGEKESIKNILKEIVPTYKNYAP
jgi:FlaA1/EpsC-like NDP-sugar epimerase